MLSLEYRDLNFWYKSAQEVELINERRELVTYRLGSMMDGEKLSRRVKMINFELQKISLDREEELE